MTPDPTNLPPPLVWLPGAAPGNTLPDHWPSVGETLDWCHMMHPATAAILVLLGIVYLLFGFYFFKTLVMVNAGLFGAAIGAIIGSRQEAALPAAAVGAIIAMAITWPLLNSAVAVMGAVLGAMIGASLWATFDGEAHYTWCGAAMGLIFFGLLSFILFRGCVITYTSLQGAGMLIFGLLGLATKYQDLGTSLSTHMGGTNYVLPIAIFVPAIIGVVFQQYNEPPAQAQK